MIWRQGAAIDCFASIPDAPNIGVAPRWVRAHLLAKGHGTASALLVLLPPGVIYAFRMDQCIVGLTAGATKG